MNSVVAVGYNNKKELINITKGKYNCIIRNIICENGHHYASNKGLVSLEIPEGIETIICNFNDISEIILPTTIVNISCINNNIKEIDISNYPNLNVLYCDKSVIIKGLNEHSYDNINIFMK